MSPTDAATDIQGLADERDNVPTGAFASLSVPSYPWLWASGWAWNGTRWMSVFLGSYLVNDLTGSPFLVQLVGAAFFAPMFVAGALAGAVADRLDRRLTILRQLAVLTPLSILVGVLVMTNRLDVWMVYPFMIAVGIGGVVDMTSRRALVFDLVGPRRATNALALESLSMSAGSMLGSMFGGAMIQFLGIGQAFFLIAGMYILAFVLLLPVKSPPFAGRQAGTSMIGDLIDGVRSLRGNPVFVSILGVTVLMNLFFFSFMPIVPVFAERLEVNALLAGVLAGGQGMGMVIAAAWFAARPPRRQGLVYVGGSFAAMAFLLVFAAVPVYGVALAALIGAGTGSSAFGTMQGVLVMTSAAPEMRGRAMGLLSVAIGSLPFGMILLGGLAQWFGAPTAVAVSVLGGGASLAIWLRVRPEVLSRRPSVLGDELRRTPAQPDRPPPPVEL